MFNCCQCPTAKISDNTLVLSLPNAMTPVVWMIDMANTGTFVMKVEATDNGLFVLQKISDDGKKQEDIAYYSSKKKAIKAMTLVSKTLNNNAKSGVWAVLKIIRSVVLTLVCLGVLVFLTMLFVPSVERLTLGSAPQKIVTQAVPQQSQTPQVETNPNAVGVPMSADEFLKNKGNTAYPF